MSRFNIVIGFWSFTCNTVAFDNLELTVVIPTSDIVYYESVSNNGTIFTLAGTDIADGFTYSFNNIPPITTTFVSQTELPFYTLPLITLLDITEPGNNNDGNYGGVQYKYEISKKLRKIRNWKCI